MSIGAVALATRDVLRTELELDAASCEVGFDGTPKPACGDFYVAVHAVGWTAPQQDWDLSEEYQIAVTLTLRTAFAMKDRWGIAVWLAANTGLEPRVRQVIVAVHHNQTLRQAADALITGGASGKILTPLQLLQVQSAVVRDFSWFGAAPPESEHEDPECGVSQTIIFGKCQRVQSIPDMD